MKGRDIMQDPVLFMAMRQHGFADLSCLTTSEEDELFTPAHPKLPSITVDGSDREPQWFYIIWNTGVKQLRYDSNEEGVIVTLVDVQLPSTVLTSYEGKELSRTVVLPGAEGYIIEKAVLSKAFISDPLNLRMSIVPASITNKKVVAMKLEAITDAALAEAINKSIAEETKSSNYHSGPAGKTEERVQYLGWEGSEEFYRIPVDMQKLRRHLEELLQG